MVIELLIFHWIEHNWKKEFAKDYISKLFENHAISLLV